MHSMPHRGLFVRGFHRVPAAMDYGIRLVYCGSPLPQAPVTDGILSKAERHNQLLNAYLTALHHKPVGAHPGCGLRHFRRRIGRFRVSDHCFSSHVTCIDCFTGGSGAGPTPLYSPARKAPCQIHCGCGWANRPARDSFPLLTDRVAEIHSHSVQCHCGGRYDCMWLHRADSRQFCA
jgi:hypothetical protein